MTEVTTRKAGKLGRLPGKAPDMGTLRDYFKGVLPTPPKSFDYAPKVAGGFPMALNDQLGDCTIAGVVHLLQLAYAEIGEVFTYPGDAAVKSTYFGLTGGQDSGCVETAVLNAWMTTGLFGTKLAAYVPINTKDDAEVAAAVYLFGGVYFGVDLPQSAETQFENNQEWHLTVPRGAPIGGHCIVGSGAKRSGIDIITWGAEDSMTYDWIDYYGSEAYAVIPEAFVEVDHGPLYNLDIVKLQADLKELQS